MDSLVSLGSAGRVPGSCMNGSSLDMVADLERDIEAIHVALRASHQKVRSTQGGELTLNFEQISLQPVRPSLSKPGSAAEDGLWDLDEDVGKPLPSSPLSDSSPCGIVDFHERGAQDRGWNTSAMWHSDFRADPHAAPAPAQTEASTNLPGEGLRPGQHAVGEGGDLFPFRSRSGRPDFSIPSASPDLLFLAASDERGWQAGTGIDLAVPAGDRACARPAGKAMAASVLPHSLKEGSPPAHEGCVRGGRLFQHMASTLGHGHGRLARTTTKAEQAAAAVRKGKLKRASTIALRRCSHNLPRIDEHFEWASADEQG